MKYIITGANGFVGRGLIKGIKTYNDPGIAIVRKGRKKQLESDSLFNEINIVELEPEEYGNIGKMFPDADCLVNLMWAGSRGTERMDVAIQEMDYSCTLSAIKSMKGTNCKCIVTAGSQAEYGNITGKITEETIPVPNTEYGKYKLRLFKEAQAFCDNNNIRLIEPRYFSLYGPGDTDKTMIVGMLKKMINNETCELTESVQMWDFFYIDDAIEALIQLINQNRDGGVYNFASGECRPLKSFVEEMKSIIGSKSELRYGAIKYPSTGMVSFEPDVSKLRDAVGRLNRTSFREGIMAVAKSL